MIAPPPAVSEAFEAALQLGPLAVLALLYGRRAHTLSRRGHPVPGWRQALLLRRLRGDRGRPHRPRRRERGTALRAHDRAPAARATSAALLIVLGLTGPLLAPVLRIRFFDRLRVLTNPLIAFPLWAIDLYVWHLPVPLPGRAAPLRPCTRCSTRCSSASGSTCGCACSARCRCRAGSATSASSSTSSPCVSRARCSATSSCGRGRVFYPFYPHGDAALHISPVADQNLAGAIMMVEESLLTLGLFCWLFLRAARESEERQDLLDFAHAQGLELTDARAARAVSAGPRRRAQAAAWQAQAGRPRGGAARLRRPRLSRRRRRQDRQLGAVGDRASAGRRGSGCLRRPRRR